MLTTMSLILHHLICEIQEALEQHISYNYYDRTLLLSTGYSRRIQMGMDKSTCFENA